MSHTVVPDHLVAQIEDALEAGLRLHRDVEWVKATVGGGITLAAFQAERRRAKISMKRARAAAHELGAAYLYLDKELIMPAEHAETSE